MSIEALKEQARRCEQKEQWGKALDLYVQAISRLDQDDHPDISLYNRAGDLSTRVGNIEGAVEQYEKAVDLYVESELPNNAIAVCKKVIRNLPTRHTIYLKMGQIRASQGFLTDARANFLAYAERMQGEGQIDEALRSLIEFADLAPDDYEIRVALASQFEQRERLGEAVDQLAQAYHVLVRLGMAEEAQGIADKIEELSPGKEIPGDVPAGETVFDDVDEFALESTALYTSDESAEVEVGEFSLDPDAEDESSEEESSEEVTVDDADLGSLEIDTGDEELEDEWLEEDSVPDDDSELPTFDLDEASIGEAVGESDLDDSEIEDDDSPLPTLDFDDLDDDDSPLPIVDFGEEDDEASEAEEAMEEAVEEAVTDARHVEPTAEEEPVAEDELVEEGVGEDDEGAEHRSLFDSGDLQGAVESLRALIDSDPDVQGHHQRMVEYAFRLNEPSALTSAYLGLAQCLERAGAEAQARAVFEQVLNSDPANVEAREALGQTTSESEAVEEVASSDDYIDLGAMLLDTEEKSTRMVVAYEEPTGDEEADFARMLSQFKDKVAENIEADDVGAHYDLGTAYKEMGLVDEAIGEFQQALRASADHLPTYEMLGQTFMEKGEFEAAIRSLTRALDTPHDVEDEFVGIYYYLGLAYQEMGNTDQALEFYDRVFALDINFRDVTERLRVLRD